MLISTQLLAALVITAIGSVIFWSNPQRVVNRFFLSFSLHLALWLTCVHLAVANGEAAIWIKMASAVAAFVPLHMWMLKQTYICIEPDRWWSDRRGMLKWLVPAVLLAACCFSKWYILAEQPGKPGPHFGPGYLVYMLGELALFGLLCRETILQLRTITGAQRLELQILLLGVIAAAFAIIALMALRAVLGTIWPIYWQPIMLLMVYSAAVVAVTTHRIFDARQVVVFVVERLLLIGAAALVAYGAWLLCEWLRFPGPFSFFITVAATLSAIGILNRWLYAAFQLYPEATAARRAAHEAAQRRIRGDELEAAFKSILKGWGHAEQVVLKVEAKKLTGELVADESQITVTMQQLRWATPERLARERTSAGREQVARFLKANRLGVLVLSEGPSLVALVGVGISASRVPFTYPQVTQLIELGSIMVSALERIHISNKAQHAEQLATVGLLGASLAHEIRNPLVTVKTFVQLLPAHYQDPAFREKFFRLMADEVDRIDRLTEQLLDMASPRTYSASAVELHPVLRASVELVAAKAAHRNVELITRFDAFPDVVFTDAAAAKQVLLNLCLNAIQAVDSNDDSSRRVWIATRNSSENVEVEVTDSGPGIAPEMVSRLFQPFQTTKSSGFGLGLAICSDILANLNATISADPPIPGRGATFRVTFPCQAS